MEKLLKKILYICAAFAVLCIGIYYISKALPKKTAPDEYAHIASIENDTVVYPGEYTGEYKGNKYYHSSWYCPYCSGNVKHGITAEQAKEEGMEPCPRCWKKD